MRIHFKPEDTMQQQLYSSLTKEELIEKKQQLLKEEEAAKLKNLSLDMSRGKPEMAQLDIALDMFSVINADTNMKADNGIDCRNYGILDGIAPAKKLMAEMMGAEPENVIIYGNSSLNIMYDTISRSYTHGVLGSTPWCKLDKIKFLCPAPGYDRHFAITEHFGIEMITIPMKEDGPDMDMVEEYVNGDASIKGIWCVPMYSNPTGITFSDEVVRRFAALKPAAEDFRIFWDNAYCIHHIYDEKDSLLNLAKECEAAGNPDIYYMFASTSKVSFAGAGIAAMASSAANIKDVKKQMTIQTIGHDKLNQLRHVLYFKDLDGLNAHMEKHAAIMRPKFDAVLEILDRELGGTGIAAWSKPKGGYFISFNSLEGCAKAIVAKCKELGVVLTGAGATFPYGKDPEDKNIRIAPSFPTIDDLEKAVEIFVLSVKLVSVEKLLADR